MSEIFKSHGGFFVQTDEDDLFYLLTCTGVGDITLPEGDETPVYCPSPSVVGEFVITDAYAGEAGLKTYSLTRPLRSTLNYLLTVLGKCRFHGRVNWRVKGSVPDVFDNYLVGLHLHNSKVSSRTVGQPVIAPEGAGEGGRVDTNADINAFDWEVIYPVLPSKIVLTETEAINDMAFDLSEACYDEEVGGDDKGKEGYFATDFLATSATNVADFWYSDDYGATWTDTATEPFAGGENQGAVQTRGGRVIVARATADGANPAEIAYSDDDGATWTNVDVGAVNGQVINDLYWLDWTHLWAVATSGYVYFSDDAGASWTAQTSGGLTAQNLNAVHAIDQTHAWAVGAAGALLKTEDGSTWQVATGPAGLADAVLDVEMRNQTRVFIVTDGNEMWVTTDAGETAGNWAERTLPGQSALSEIRRIEFDPELHYFGFVIANTAAPLGSAYRSEDGGASWQLVSGMPTNAGLNALRVIDPNTAFIAGEPQGGTAFMAKIQKVS